MIRACRRTTFATLALLGSLGVATEAVADEAQCVAASEKEIATRKAGKLKEALKELAVCAQPSCSAEVRAECTKRIAEVQRAEPAVILGVTNEAGDDMGAVSVSLDGAPFVSSLDGRAVAVDPGPHTFRFEAVGKKPLEKAVILREGEKDRHINVVLASHVSTVPLLPRSAREPTTGPSAPEAHLSGTWSGRKTLAVVSGVVGVAGLALGSVFGLAAKSDWSSSQGLCSQGHCPSASAHDQALSDQQSASRQALVSTLSFSIGAAAVAGALVLWFTAPTGEGSQAPPSAASAIRIGPVVGEGSGGVVMLGVF